MRVAVISDVHGNSLALDAVLDDIARHNVEAILGLGDNVSGPVDPSGSAERLMALGGSMVRGNHDRWTVDPNGLVSGAGAVDHFAHSVLSEAQLSWLAGLPKTALYADTIFLCHGTPDDDEGAWLDNFYKGRTTTLPSEAQVAALAEGLPHPVMLCGHTHTPRSVRLRDGRLIVNPGAVGMQLVHGSPDARYAIVEQRVSGWHTHFLAVPYDHEAAARRAADNGFPQWAQSLTNGWVGPESLGSF